MKKKKNVDPITNMINKLGLEQHAEGGYFKELTITSAGSSIYYMLTKDQPVSHFHQLGQDEVWHFNAGQPITIVELSKTGEEASLTILGNNMEDVLKGKMVMQHTIPKGTWFAAFFGQAPKRL